MSTAIKTTAIVLRARRFSETSLIATLLSREHGRLDVLAKGARREKSPLFGHLDLYQKEDVLVLRRPAAGLDLLTEAAFADEHVGLRFCPPAFAAAGFLSGLVAEATLPGAACPEVFSVLEKAFSVLSGLGEAAVRAGLAAGGAFSAAEKQILAERTLTLALRDTLAALGFGLELTRCVVCGTEAIGPGAGLSRRSGGLVCRGCRNSQPTVRDVVGITPAALAWLAGRERRGERKAGEETEEVGEAAAETKVSASEQHKALRLLIRYAQYVLDRPLAGRRALAGLLRL